MPQIVKSAFFSPSQFLGTPGGVAQRVRRMLDVVPGLRGVHILRALRGRPIKVIADDNAKIAYFPIPKTASSTLTAAMYRLEVGSDCEVLSHDALHAHFNFRGRNWVTLESARALPHFKFAVVRDPLARFVSGYMNRIVQRSEHVEGADMLRALKRNGLPVAPTLEEFAANLDAYCAISLTLKWHFIPQTDVLGGWDYLDEVYDMDALDTLKADVRARCGVDLDLGHRNASPRHKPVEVSRTVKRFVMERYAKDYQAFAALYSPPLESAHADR